MIFQMLQIVMA